MKESKEIIKKTIYKIIVEKNWKCLKECVIFERIFESAQY